MNPRVLLSASLVGYGGHQTHTFHLARALALHGATVTVAARSYALPGERQQILKKLGVRVISTPFSLEPSWTVLRSFWLWTAVAASARGYFDVFYSIGPGRLHAWLDRLVRSSGWRFWNEVNSGEPWPEGGTAYAQHIEMLRGMDALIAQAPQVATNLRRYLPFPIPIKSIACMADSPVADPLPRRPGKGQVRLAYFGRLMPSKGVYKLVELWPELHMGSARLDIYGEGPDRERIENMITQYGLGDRITVHGHYSHGWGYAEAIHQADLVVLPTSPGEGQPLVLIEAMSYGVPFVATDSGGIVDLGWDNPDVLVVKGTKEALKDGIETMVDRIRSNQISADRLVAVYRERYSFDALTPQWAAALLEPERFWAQAEIERWRRER